MDISFEDNFAEWAKDLRHDEQWVVPYATAMALTWTAQDVKLEHQRLLPLVFDRPTRYTVNSLQVTPANKSRLRASVFFKESNRQKYGRHYLMPQVQGGTRPHKRFEHWLIQKGIMASDEFAVPARGVKLDSFGNISAGTITQILSQLQAGPDATQWQTARSRKRAGPSRTVYFTADDNSGWKRGIWRRVGKRIEPVLLFLKNVRYEERYAFFDISRQKVEARLPQHFRDALVKMRSKQSTSTAVEALPGF